MAGSFPITIVTAIVSPRARASARNTDPMIPSFANGSTACHVDSHLRGAEGERRFPLFAGHGHQRFARYGDNEGEGHDREDHARGQVPDAEDLAVEEITDEGIGPSTAFNAG